MLFMYNHMKNNFGKVFLRPIKQKKIFIKSYVEKKIAFIHLCKNRKDNFYLY